MQACRPARVRRKAEYLQALDPVGAGFVESLARPGGNITGFVSFEYNDGKQMAGDAQTL